MKYAVIALMTFVAFKSGAQNNLHSYALKRSVFQDDLQYLFTVLDSEKRGVNHYDSEKIYYWMKAQRVVATQGASSGDLLHGTFEAFYQDKQLARKGAFNRGLKNGKWQYWRPDGSLLKAETWHKGSLRGKQIQYDRNGGVSATTYISHFGTKRRTQDSLILFRNGTIHKVTTFDSLGNIATTEHWKNNQLHGVFKTYENGNCINKTRYKNGSPVEPKQKLEQTVDEEKSSLKDKFQKLFKRKNKDDSEKESNPSKNKKNKRAKG